MKHQNQTWLITFKEKYFLFRFLKTKNQIKFQLKNKQFYRILLLFWFGKIHYKIRSGAASDILLFFLILFDKCNLICFNDSHVLFLRFLKYCFRKLKKKKERIRKLKAMIWKRNEVKFILIKKLAIPVESATTILFNFLETVLKFTDDFKIICFSL